MSSFSSSSGLFRCCSSFLLPRTAPGSCWWQAVAYILTRYHSFQFVFFSFFLSAGKLKRKLVGALGSLSSCLYVIFPGDPPPFPSVVVVQNETCWVLSERLPPPPACNVRGKTPLWGLGGGIVQSSPVQSPISVQSSPTRSCALPPPCYLVPLQPFRYRDEVC